MNRDPYLLLAQRLDSLPNGFPPTDDGSELRLLAHIFTPDQALLAAQLRMSPETLEQIATRLGAAEHALRDQLKQMARRGLIRAERMEGGIGYALMPFVVGIYEMQVDRMDADLARLFETYYLQAFGQVLNINPSVHRVIPVGESVRVDMAIYPYESVAEILDGAKAWGVLDCICRKQKALIGDPCDHPVDICMALSQRPGAFDQSPVVKALTRQQAQDTLHRAAKAGLVHSVSNHKGMEDGLSGIEYICNCCTCSCGILRSIAELGIANAVARSAFINQVDEDLCTGCELCLEACQFDALSVDHLAQVDLLRCVGCGVCVPVCPDGALVLVRRPDEEMVPVPDNQQEWLEMRAANRGLDLGAI